MLSELFAHERADEDAACEASGLIDPEPPWVEAFLSEMRRMADRTGVCDVQIACDLAGVSRARVYCYRKERRGERLRVEWDRVVRTPRRRG